MFKYVKDKILYQATNWDYKVGDKIYFGRKRNFQAVRAFDRKFIMSNGEYAALYLYDKVKSKKKLNALELKEINNVMFDYAYCIREYAYEYCRKKYFPKCPSRLKGMFCCDNVKDAKCYLNTAKAKNNQSINAKVIKVKLNGKLLKTSNNFNRRDCTFDEFVENAKKYFNGVDEKFHDASVEYLFEGWAEIVDIIK